MAADAAQGLPAAVADVERQAHPLLHGVLDLVLLTAAGVAAVEAVEVDARGHSPTTMHDVLGAHLQREEPHAVVGSREAHAHLLPEGAVVGHDGGPCQVQRPLDRDALAFLDAGRLNTADAEPSTPCGGPPLGHVLLRGHRTQVGRVPTQVDAPVRRTGLLGPVRRCEHGPLAVDDSAAATQRLGQRDVIVLQALAAGAVLDEAGRRDVAVRIVEPLQQVKPISDRSQQVGARNVLLDA
uniref:Uncharacterized protein n=1 Tax=uncultured marine virus TaxID=186617 RepID=A0A0F7L6D3_9VIRU|nr:hypothetical protein [uncultured marine virus]